MVSPIAERLNREGDRMSPKEKDRFIEEVDQELRSVDARLKRVLSQTDQLLHDHAKGTEQREENPEENTEEG